MPVHPILAVVALIALLVAPHKANATDGNELLSWCTSSDPFEQGLCFGFIDGAMGGTQWGIQWTIGRGTDLSAEEQQERTTAFYGVCLPTTVTQRQLRDLVVEALQNEPQHRGDAADGLVHIALLRNYPCE